MTISLRALSLFALVDVPYAATSASTSFDFPSLDSSLGYPFLTPHDADMKHRFAPVAGKPQTMQTRRCEPRRKAMRIFGKAGRVYRH